MSEEDDFKSPRGFLKSSSSLMCLYALPEIMEKVSIFVDNELKDRPHALPDWNTEF